MTERRNPASKLGLARIRAGVQLGAWALLASAAMPISASAQEAPPSSAPASSSTEVGVLPEEYLTGPLPPGGTETVQEETFIDEDGVETVIRTRRIEPRRSPPPVQASYLGAPVQYGPNGQRLPPGAALPTGAQPYTSPNYPPQTYAQPAYPPQGYGAPSYGGQAYPPQTIQQPPAGYGAAVNTAGGPGVMTSEQWIAECERRTQQQDDGGGNGQAIGGVLGAIAGGIIGNRVATGDRLAGSLIGLGTGGIAGLLLGGLLSGGGDKDEDEGFDCRAALDSHLSQYNGSAARGSAARSIPGPAPAQAPQGAPVSAPGAGFPPPSGSQNPVVPIEYQQQQQVVVRQTVREVSVPASTPAGSLPN